MILPVFSWFLFISSTFKILISANYTKENCQSTMEKLKTNFYCDDFLVSRFYSENENIRRLFKYINYKMEDIEKELNETCSNFAGVIQEQSLQCEFNRIYRSCRTAMTDGSGVYYIQVRDTRFLVYCLQDPDGGAPWTIIQRRDSEANKFDRSQEDYINGFGDMLHNFWLGLDKVHNLTNIQPFELWIKIIDSKGNESNAKYDYFAISSEKKKYSITVLGNYTGTAGDALRAHEGCDFMFYHKKGKGCANKAKSGWWFKSSGKSCGDCNLNGEFYGKSASPPDNKTGIFWKGLTGSLPYTHIAIREKYSEYC